MIRTVRIPTRVSRLGQSSSSITYYGSTCTVVDPITGLCMSDVALGDESNPLPEDYGSGAAVGAWADSYNARANAALLNAAQTPASLVLANSLMSGNIPSPLPGLGLSVPDPLKKYLFWGAVAAGILFLSGGSSRGSR
jgi:hypothetical protein